MRFSGPNCARSGCNRSFLHCVVPKLAVRFWVTAPPRLAVGLRARPSPFALLAGCRAPGDQSGSATVGCEAERPADENEQAILEADQVPEVHDKPRCPGEKTAEPESLDFCDGRRPPDRGEVALVAVAERTVL